MSLLILSRYQAYCGKMSLWVYESMSLWAEEAGSMDTARLMITIMNRTHTPGARFVTLARALLKDVRFGAGFHTAAHTQPTVFG